MECTLAMLVTCFSWSNLYLDAGLRYQDAGIYREYEQLNVDRLLLNGQQHEFNRELLQSHDDSADNPYGQLSLGYELNLKSVTWRIEASHLSSLATSRDRGINSLSISARWFPFR